MVAVIASRKGRGDQGAPESSRQPRTSQIAIGSNTSLPGRNFPVRNVPVRNPSFVGREEIFELINNALIGGPAVIHALHGWGGVGKTQSAIEYSYRYNADYDIVWWFAAEQPQLIAEQYAQLAFAVGLAKPGTDTMLALGAARRHLSERSRWLVIFDNAEDPEALRPWIPDGSGHVLITSRRADWRELATPIPVSVLPRADSLALLCSRTQISVNSAHKLAEKLGDLPLALVQAAGFIDDTGIPVDDYLASLDGEASRLLQEGRPASYPLTLPATIILAAERAKKTDVPGWQLLRLCAVLGPERIPIWLFTSAGDDVLPAPLARVVRDAVRLRRSIGLLTRLGLARADNSAIQLHRLTQAILCSSASPQRFRADLDRIRKLLVNVQPPETDDPQYWPLWTELAPHILATASRDSNDGSIRDLICSLIRVQLKSGEIAESLALIERLHRQWSDIYGPDDLTVLHAAFVLAYAYTLSGRWTEARDLDASTYANRLRQLGPDHVDTLESCNNLGGSLARAGDLAAGRAMEEDALARQRRVLGDEHPNTLRSANNVASRMRESGELEAAKSLHQDTWERSRRVSGMDHPSTLVAAFNLGVDMLELGDFQQASQHLAKVHSAFSRVLGDNHPDTLRCADRLATAAANCGEHSKARVVLEEVLTRRREVLGDSHPHVAETAAKIARLP